MPEKPDVQVTALEFRIEEQGKQPISELISSILGWQSEHVKRMSEAHNQIVSMVVKQIVAAVRNAGGDINDVLVMVGGVVALTLNSFITEGDREKALDQVHRNTKSRLKK